MCNHYRHHGCFRNEDPVTRKAKFAKSVRAYILVNFIMIAIMLSGSNISGWWTAALIWGAVLAANGLSIYGWPQPQADDDDYEDEQDRYREQRDYHRRPKRRQWRNKDLV